MRGFLAGTGAPLLERGFKDLEDAVALPAVFRPVEDSLVFGLSVGFAGEADADFFRLPSLSLAVLLFVLEASFGDTFLAAFAEVFLASTEGKDSKAEL